MAVISASVATGGRNTGFSYVFNASRAVFQGSAQNVTVKDVAHKGKDAVSPKKCKVEGTVSDDLSVSTAKVPLTESRAESACAPSRDVGRSDATAVGDRTKPMCSDMTEPDKSVISENATGKSRDSRSKEKPSSIKSSTLSKGGRKDTKESANNTVNVLTKDASSSKTPAGKCGVLKNSSPDSLITQSQVSKTQQNLSKVSVSVEDKSPEKYQINCDKSIKLGECSRKDSSSANTNESLDKSKSDPTLSGNIKGKEGRKDNNNNVESKSLYEKRPLDEKSKQRTSSVRQKDVGKNDPKNIAEDSKKSETKIITQSVTNKRMAEKLQPASASPSAEVKPKQETTSNCSGEFRTENQQMKYAANENSVTKSHSETVNKTKPEKSQGDGNKLFTEKQKNPFTTSVAHYKRSKSSERVNSKCQKEVQDTQKPDETIVQNKANDPKKQTIEKDKNSVTTLVVHSKRSKSSERVNSKCQKEVQDLALKASEKPDETIVHNKANDPKKQTIEKDKNPVTTLAVDSKRSESSERINSKVQGPASKVSEKTDKTSIKNKANDPMKQTVEKKKNTVTALVVDSKRSESSDRMNNKYQKDTQDTVSKVSEKTDTTILKTKANDTSLRKCVKERGMSPSRISTDKRSSDLKGIEVCKATTTRISQISPNETSGEKLKRKPEMEIDSSKQFAKLSKDNAQQSLPNTAVKAIPKVNDAGKLGSSQKQIANISTAEKSQINLKKTEKLDLGDTVGETPLATSKSINKKSENGEQIVTAKTTTIKHLADKLKEEDLTAEKTSKDDDKKLSTKVDTISLGNSAQSSERKTLGKRETSRVKVENSEKASVNLLEILGSGMTEKSQSDVSTDKCDGKRTTEKIEKEVCSETCVATEEKAKTDNLLNKKVDSATVRPQKLSSNSADSRRDDKEMKSVKYLQEPKTSLPKSKEEDETNKTLKHLHDKPQQGSAEKASPVDKVSVDKNRWKSHPGTNVSTKENHPEITEHDEKKLSVTPPSDDRVSIDPGQTDNKAIRKSEISTGEPTTELIDHNSDTSEYVQCNKKTLFASNEKVAACIKDEVSKLSKRKSKRQNESSRVAEVASNTSISSGNNTDALVSKLECNETEGSTGQDRTITSELTGKSVNKSDATTCKTSVENFVNDNSQLQDSKVKNFKSSDSSISVVDSEVKSEMHPRYPATDSIDQTETSVVNKNSTHEDLLHPSQGEGVKSRRYTKENRPCSYPTTERREFAGLEQRSSSQQSLDHYTRDCMLSAVDYAKTRFQNVHQTPRCDEVIKPKPKHTQMVNKFKSLWENYEHKGAGLSISHSTAARKLHMQQKISFLTTEGQRDADFPIRPFLTKGSVAERVLLFECCPERALDRASGKSKSLLYNTWKSAGLHHKTRFWEVIGEKDRPPRSFYVQKDRDHLELSKAAAYCRFSKSSNSLDIPLFHYPKGRPLNQTEIERHLKEIKIAFSAFTDEKVTKEEFGIITKACNVPLYWKLPLFLSAADENKPFLQCDVFLQYWKRIISVFHDEASQFVAVLTKCSRDYLLPDDFIPMIQDIIDTHPGLTFLKEATEFHSRYVHTVISRIYYCVNKSWSGKITVAELRKSNFLQIISLLEKEDDINQITDYFSYEHFYVIYCKFWELDKDHDLFIDKNDLQRHNDGAISSRMIERIFSGAVTHSPMQKDGKMNYTDFVWFLFSEEDKRHPRSIEYWFRCMDLDGDGYLSMYEMEYFYEEQLQRMEALNIETLPFKDCLCQMFDMIRPKIPGLISLTDLKKCKMTPLFFDTFFNLEKYLDHEQRDPFASQREQDTDISDMSDWDRYAAEEYELLVAEEGGSEHSDDLIYEDYAQEDDELLSSSQKINGSNVISHRSNSVDLADEDEYADTELTYY